MRYAVLFTVVVMLAGWTKTHVNDNDNTKFDLNADTTHSIRFDSRDTPTPVHGIRLTNDTDADGNDH